MHARVAKSELCSNSLSGRQNYCFVIFNTSKAATMKWPLLIIILIIRISSAYAQPSATEYAALMDLYSSTNGANWTNNTGWSAANPNVVQSVVGWYGVQTDANGHVIHLDMDGVADFTIITDSQGLQVYTGNNLVGSLPSSIGDLTYLQALNVGGNQLTGSLPEEIGQLTNLVWLVGSTNQFTGSLPSTIGNLTKLDRILMEKNQLSGEIPSSIGKLTDLWALLLNDNQLTGSIPDSLGNCKKLRFFYLYNNQLTGSIPESIGTMTAAYRIGFQNNQLTGTVPASLANLSNLQLLYLSDNKLEGQLPGGLSNIAPLQTLVFRRNKFTFSSFLELKSTFTGTFAYSPQDLIDEEKTVEGTPGQALTLTTNIDRTTIPASVYQWFRMIDGNAEPLNAASIEGHSYTFGALLESDADAEYYYTINNPSAPALTLTSRLQHISIASNGAFPDVNYIRTVDVTVAGKTEASQVESALVNERITNYTYFDGLGRPMQQVAQQGSPSKRDIVTPIIYDEYGREGKKYLPFVSGSNGSYKLNGEIVDASGSYIGVARAFYIEGSNNKVADDSRPFSEIIFESSPLNRPDKEYGPGEAWAPTESSDGKFIKRQYLSNVHSLTGNQTAEAIIAWTVDEAGTLTKESAVEDYITEGGCYDSNQLYIKVTLDENGNAVREYTNKQGQVVLKKVQVVAKPNPSDIDLNNMTEWACTYYVYDDLGNLRIVLPPEGVKQYLSIPN